MFTIFKKKEKPQPRVIVHPELGELKYFGDECIFVWTSVSSFQIAMWDNVDGQRARRPVEYRHPGGVIPPVLQAGQALQQDGSGLLLPDIAYNSTHILVSSLYCQEDKLAAI